MRASLVVIAQWVRVNKPVFLIPLLVWLRATLVWARPSGREAARADLRTLLGDIEAPELDERARRHIRFSCLRSEARFHHEVNSGQPVVGREHLEVARGRGRGVVLAFVHHGHYEGSFPSVAAAGFPLTVVAAAPTAAAGAGDLDVETWRVHHARTILSHPGVRLVSVDIGFRGMLAARAGGYTVALACAFPGGRERVLFLGREWWGMTSVGGLSLRSGAPVVPLRSRRSGDGQKAVIDLGAPLFPEEFDDASALTAAVLAAFEPAVLAWPEAYDVPARMWIPADS